MSSGVPMRFDGITWLTMSAWSRATSLFAARAQAFLLGHIHQHQGWQDEGRRVAYAGSIGRYHHGEREAKGFLLWEVGAASAGCELVATPARRTVDLVFEGLPDLDAIAKAAQDLALAGAYVRVRWQVGEEERASVDRDAIKRALGEAADVQLEGRVVPVVRSRAAGISRANSLQEKVRVWARATGSEDGPLLERLAELAHRQPSQIAGAILAGEEPERIEEEQPQGVEQQADELAVPSVRALAQEARQDAVELELF